MYTHVFVLLTVLWLTTEKKNVIDQSFPVSRPITAWFGAALLKQACILLVPSQMRQLPMLNTLMHPHTIVTISLALAFKLSTDHRIVFHFALNPSLMSLGPETKVASALLLHALCLFVCSSTESCQLCTFLLLHYIISLYTPHLDAYFFKIMLWTSCHLTSLVFTF